MRKRQRLAFFAIGGLGLLAAVAPGLAAGIAVPGGSDVPAAGQGAVTVQGFDVCDIDWVVSDSTSKVTSVSFTIERSEDGANACGANTSTVDSVADGSTGDAVVRVRLEASASEAGWAGCVTTAGAATCTLDDSATPSQQMLAADLVEVNIIAYDRG
jgi:hypothetical protein